MYTSSQPKLNGLCVSYIVSNSISIFPFLISLSSLHFQDFVCLFLKTLVFAISLPLLFLCVFSIFQFSFSFFILFLFYQRERTFRLFSLLFFAALFSLVSYSCFQLSLALAACVRSCVCVSLPSSVYFSSTHQAVSTRW